MKIGKKFKILRNRKNLTQEDVCDKIISRSRLSEFEQGIGNISYNTFIKLLNRINVSIIEFELFMSTDNMSIQAEFYADVNKAKQEENIFWLKSLEKEQHTLYKTTQNQCFLFNSIIARQYRYSLIGEPFETYHTQKIYDYLNSVKRWCMYEINLFGNTVFCMNYNKVKSLCHDMIKSQTSKQQKIFRRNDAVLLVFNIIYMCLENKELADAEIFIKKAQQMIDQSYDYYEQVKLMSLDGFRLILSGNIQEGKAKTVKATQTMELVGDYKNANRHVKYLNKILKKVETNEE